MKKFLLFLISCLFACVSFATEYTLLSPLTAIVGEQASLRIAKADEMIMEEFTLTDASQSSNLPEVTVDSLYYVAISYTFETAGTYTYVLVGKDSGEIGEVSIEVSDATSDIEYVMYSNPAEKYVAEVGDDLTITINMTAESDKAIFPIAAQLQPLDDSGDASATATAISGTISQDENTITFVVPTKEEGETNYSLQVQYESGTDFMDVDVVFPVTITEAGSSSKSIGFSEPGYSVLVDETTDACLDLYGFGNNVKITYEVSNSDVVSCALDTATNCFTIKGLVAGSSMLYVTLVDGEDEYTASAIISVAGTSTYMLNAEEYQLAVGESKLLELYVGADGTTYTGAIEWNVSGGTTTAIAEIDETNTLTAIAVGQGTIEAKIDGEVVATASLVVTDAISDAEYVMYSNPAEKYVAEVGDDLTITINMTAESDNAIYPIAAQLQPLDDSGDASATATAISGTISIDDNTITFVVPTKEEGETNYSLQVQYESGTDFMDVDVVFPITITESAISYKLNAEEFQLAVGESKLLELYVGADGTTYTGAIEWNVSGGTTTAIAEIDETNTLTAIAVGQGTIEAKIDGEVVATASLVVTDAISDVEYVMYSNPAEKYVAEVGDDLIITINMTAESDNAVYPIAAQLQPLDDSGDASATATAISGTISLDDNTITFVVPTKETGVTNYSVQVQYESGAEFMDVDLVFPVTITESAISYMLNAEEYQLAVGESKLLELYVGADGMTYTGEIEWNVLGGTTTAIAEIDSTNTLKALAVGQGTIEAKLDGEVVATASLVVTDAISDVEYVMYSNPAEKYVAEVGDDLIITINMTAESDNAVYPIAAQIQPLDDSGDASATATAISGTISLDDNIITFVVPTKETGVTNYSVQVQYESGAEFMDVDVVFPVTITETVVTYMLNAEAYDLYVGQTKKLELYAGDELYEGDIEWNVMGDATSAIASVDAENVITALSAGQGSIEAKVAGEVVATATLYIMAAPKYVSPKTPVIIAQNGEFEFTVFDTDDNPVEVCEFEVSNSVGAMDGMIFYPSEDTTGFATLYAFYFVDDEKVVVDSVNLLVVDANAQLSITPSIEKMTVGETQQLTVKMGDYDVTNFVEYLNMDTAQTASISATGLVTALSQGLAQYGIVYNGDVQASINENGIEIVEPDYSVSFGNDLVTELYPNNQGFIHVDLGSGFYQKEYKFTCVTSDTTIATITEVTDGKIGDFNVQAIAPGTTDVIATVECEGKTYTAKASIVVNKSWYTKPEKIELVAKGSGYDAPSVSVVIYDSNDSLVSGLEESTYYITVEYEGGDIDNFIYAETYDSYVSLFTEANYDMAGTLVIKKDGVVVGTSEVVVKYDNKMDKPVNCFDTDEIHFCFTPGAPSKESKLEWYFRAPQQGLLQWYDENMNKLDSIPNPEAKVGDAVYFVKQLPRDETSALVESEPLKVVCHTHYVTPPTVNMKEQRVCDNDLAVDFVATAQEGLQLYWFDPESNMTEGSTITPTINGTYEVNAKETYGDYNDQKTYYECTSEYVKVTFARGNSFTPNFSIDYDTIVLNNSYTCQVERMDDVSYVWSLNGTVVEKGEEYVFNAEETGNYGITCRAIDDASGCYSEMTDSVAVIDVNIPVTGIDCPNEYYLGVGEKVYFAHTVYPMGATDQTCIIKIDSTNIATAVGSTIKGLQQGETKATVYSLSNPEVSKEFMIIVDEYVEVVSIQAPQTKTMKVGDVAKIVATALPENADDSDVFFETKADDVISITSDGQITAKAVGTAIVAMHTSNGVSAKLVVYVTDKEEEITDIKVPEKIQVKVGQEYAIPYSVVPVSLNANNLTWSSDDDLVASVADGVISAKQAGEATITVQSGSVQKSIDVTITANYPVIFNLPDTVTVPLYTIYEEDLLKSVSGDTVVNEKFNIPFAQYVNDLNDGTSGVFSGFKFSSSDSELGLSLSADGQELVIESADSLEKSVTITVDYVEDAEGGQQVLSSASFEFVIAGTINAAPSILVDTISVKAREISAIALKEIVSDDFTAIDQLDIEVEGNGIAAEVAGDQLILDASNSTEKEATIAMKVVDEFSSFTKKDIAVVFTSLPNEAPVLADIDMQVSDSLGNFAALDLTQYVTDDYTSPSSINWEVLNLEDISEDIVFSIVDGIMTPIYVNPFWNGVVGVEISAYDDEGLYVDGVVYYQRNVTQEAYETTTATSSETVATVWEGAPQVSITTMRQYGVPGSVFTLMASISSFDCTWEWTIDGASGIDQSSLFQMITFDKPGPYTVSLTVTSADGQYQTTANLDIELLVLGIYERDAAICYGDPVTLTTFAPNSYWSNDLTGTTMTDYPEETTTYSVTMKWGTFTFVDSVQVAVSTPVSLMEDSVMCAGTTFELIPQGEYVSYAWNTGATTASIEIPAEVASYSVLAVDNQKCASSDTFNITKVNDLPIINLGEDLAPCDGDTVTLDAGAGFTYNWNNGSSDQTISLIGGTSNVSVVITDGNMCQNSDTVLVAFKYPYAEKLGVATFSETSDHVILAWEKTKDVNTESYRIERETGTTDNWVTVGETTFEEPGLVVDEDVNYKERAFKYRLVTVDGCGNEAISEVHRTMGLSILMQTNGKVSLHWTAYEPMEDVTQYLVLRGTDATALDTVAEVPASNLYEIWNETEDYDASALYKVCFRLKEAVDETKYNEKVVDTDAYLGQKTYYELPEQMGADGASYYISGLKAESGPFSLALSNIAEAENAETAIDEVSFGADVVVYPTVITSVINVVVASDEDQNYTIDVVNSNGQVVLTTQTGAVAKALVQLPAEQLVQGTYTVRVSANGQMKAMKVVK